MADKNEVSVFATSSDGSAVDFTVISVTKDEIDQVTTVVMTNGAGAAGEASIVIGTAIKSALPFYLEFVSIPIGNPEVSIKPQSAECRHGIPVSVAVGVTNFRQLADIAHLRVKLDNITLPTTKVSSFMPGTTFTVEIELDELAGGVHEFLVWSAADDTKVGSVTYTCKDVTMATLVGVSPNKGFAGTDTKISVFILDSGYGVGDLVYLAQGDGGAKQITNAAVGGSPMEIVITLTSSAEDHGAVLISIAPCIEPSLDNDCKKKKIDFTFTFLDPTAVRMLSFFPPSEYVSGRTNINVRVKNLPQNLVESEVMLDFGHANATCTAIDTPGGVLSFEIPTERSSSADVVSLLLHLPGEQVPLVSPSTFEYLEMKTPRITSISPKRSSIRAAITARIMIEDFPSTETSTDISVQMVFADGATIDLVVLAVQRKESARQQYEVQSWHVDVVTPVDSDPEDAKSIEGIVALRVVHNVFGNFVELQNGLSLYDDALPQVNGVSGPEGSGTSSTEVPMSHPSEVTISMKKASKGVTADAYTAMIDSTAVSVTFATVDPLSRLAQVIIIAPSSLVAVQTHGIVAFGALPTASTCAASCCKDSSCATACPGVDTVCFSLDYFDDLVPIATFKSPLFGPKIGGHFILVSLVNFPLLQSADGVRVTFGGIDGEVQLLSSSATETILTLVTPEYAELGAAASALVDAIINPLVRPDRAVSFQFRYDAVSPAVTKIAPVAALNDAVVEVKAKIDFFPFPVAVLVTFDGVEVESSIHPTSNKKSSLVLFSTRTGLVGNVTVVIRPKICNDGCDQVEFSFQNLDATVPELFNSPRGMAKQHEKLPAIILEKFPAEYSEVAVSLVTTDNEELAGTVETPVRIGNLVRLNVVKPTALSEGIFTVRIDVTDSGGKKSVSIVGFVVYDGFAPEIIAKGPEKVPTVLEAAGRSLQLQSTVFVRVANFPQSLVPSDVSIAVGEMLVEVKSVSDLVSCTPTAIDCNRTRIEFAAPALESPGSKTFTMSVPAMDPLSFDIEYAPPCDYQTLCAGIGMVFNYQMMLGSPKIECDPAYCIKEGSISKPTIDMVMPSEGLVVGGTLVTLSITNFPAFTTGDIKVVAGEGVTKVFGTAVSLQQETGSSLTSSAGVLVISTPSVDSATESLTFTVSTKIDSVTRSASFDFDYLPALSGPTIIAEVLPASLYETSLSDTLSFTLTLGNIPRLKRPYDVKEVLVEIGDLGYAPVSKISSSLRYETKVLVEVETTMAVGNLVVKAYAKARGVDTAGSKSLIVIPTPAAVAASLYPGQGSTDAGHQIAVTAQYLPPNLVIGDITSAKVVTAQGNEYDVSLDQVKSKRGQCLHGFCSLFDIKVSVSALPESDNGGGLATFTISDQNSAFLSWEFKYIASGTPKIIDYKPKSQNVVIDETSSEASRTTVTIYLKDFPSPQCKDDKTCATEASLRQTTVKFGAWSVETPSRMTQLDNGMLQLEVLAPAGTTSSVQQIRISAEAAGEAALVQTDPVDFTYTKPAPSISPVDAPVSGGQIVTVTAYGVSGIPDLAGIAFSLVDATGNEVAATGAAQTLVATETQVVSKMVLELMMPAKVAGIYRGQVKRALDSTLIGGFEFEYFETPLVAYASQIEGTVNGLTSDGSTMSLEVQNFPPISSGADVIVSFGTESSHVIDFITFKGGVFLTLHVPPAANLAPGAITLSIQFAGAEPTPPGGQVGVTYERSAKVASLTFTYFVPLPEVISVKWCEFCNIGRACLVNGRCKDGKVPKDRRAPLRGVGTLTVQMINAPEVDVDSLGAISPDSVVSASLGEATIASFKRVAWKDKSACAFELSTPKGVAGQFNAEISVQPAGTPVPSTASFAFSFYDDNIALGCGNCWASQNGGIAIPVMLTNFLLSTDLAASDQIRVLFGSIDASAVEITSTNTTHTEFLITPPSFTCTSCAFKDGSADTLLSIVAVADSSRGAQAPFVFWAPPVILSITMDNLGLLLTVMFDHETNRAGMGIESQSCSDVFVSDAGFAKMSGITNSKCFWVSNSVLSIQVGVGATIVPGDALTLKSDTIKSANGVSSFSASIVAIVSPPVFLKTPSLSVSGVKYIDQCSPLSLQAFSDSPRPPDFSWRCVNCFDTTDADRDSTLQSFNTALKRYTSSSVDLAEGTPEMPLVDFEYEIGVTATDMFGSTSEEVIFRVFKAAEPAPQLRFAEPKLTITRDMEATTKATTVFSKCSDATAQILFQWTQVSGPTTISADYLGNIPQILIPAGTLQASSTYVVSLTITMSNDLSKSSSSELVIEVGVLPLVARIKGAATRRQSTKQPIALDAGESTDPDVDASADQGLTFTWACDIFDGSISQSCRDTAGAKITMGENSSVIVPADSMAQTTDYPYKFTLTVSKAGKSPVSYSISVVLVQQDIPSVELVVVGDFTNQKDGSVKINANSVLRLQASCSSQAGSQEWSVSPEVELASPSFVITPTSLVYLGEGANALSAGNTYTFKSTCTVVGDIETVTGVVEQVVVVNSPPSGVPCSTCLVSGNNECTKVGNPVFDIFRITCENWADSDGGLEYRFGYNVAGDDKEVLFEWSSARSVELRLPSGSISLTAQVRDALGARSTIMRSEVSVAAPESRRRALLAATATTEDSSSGWLSRSTRRLLATFDWDAAATLLTNELQGGNYATLNELASSLVLEIDSQNSAGDLSDPESQAQKDMIFDNLNEAAATVDNAKLLSQGYVCASLNLAGALTANKEHLNISSVERMLSYLGVLINDQHSSVASFDGVCTGSALGALANVLAAHSGNATDIFIRRLETSVESTLREAAAGLIAGQVYLQQSNASVHSVARHTYASRGWAHASLAAESPAYVLGAEATYSMPDNFEQMVGLSNQHDVSVHVGAFHVIPDWAGVTPVGPLVKLALLQNGGHVLVQNLSLPINISIPFTAAHMATGLPGVCKHVNGSELSEEGVTTLQVPGGVICQTNHLSSYTVVPGPQVEETTTTTPQETTTTTPEATTTNGGTTTSSEVITTTAEDATTTTPDPSSPYVEMQVSLPYTAAQFDTTKQQSFMQGVAAAANVDQSKVEITKITEVTSRRAAQRRLLASTVQVDFKIIVESTATASNLASSLDATTLNTALAQQGVSPATITKAATVVEPSSPSPPPSGGDGGGSGGGGSGGGNVAGPVGSDAGTTPAPSTPSIVVTTNGDVFVGMVLSLPLVRSDFDAASQAKFRSALATVAGVPVDKVDITSIREVGDRRAAQRRLLGTKLEVLNPSLLLHWQHL